MSAYIETMCGIAGYSLKDSSDIPAWIRDHPLGAETVCTRLLFAALAERGADAAGFAASDGHSVICDKHEGEVAEFMPHVVVPAGRNLAMMHVRDHTKGTPGLEANNHPVQHGSILCVHNGRIANDDLLFAQFSQLRQEPGMTVDTEAIAMLAGRMEAEQVPTLLEGSYATAWMDEHKPESMMLLRGNGRPLHLVRRPSSVWFASTFEAMSWFAQQMEWADAQIERLSDGTGLRLEGGQTHDEFHFSVNHYVEEPFGGYEWANARAAALREHTAAQLRQ